MGLPSSAELQAMIDVLDPIRKRASELAENERNTNPWGCHQDAVYIAYCKVSTNALNTQDTLKDLLERALWVEQREQVHAARSA